MKRAGIGMAAAALGVALLASGPAEAFRGGAYGGASMADLVAVALAVVVLVAGMAAVFGRGVAMGGWGRGWNGGGLELWRLEFRRG